MSKVFILKEDDEVEVWIAVDGDEPPDGYSFIIGFGATEAEAKRRAIADLQACIHALSVEEADASPRSSATASDVALLQAYPASSSADLPALRERLLKAIQPVGDCCPFCDVRYDAPEGKHGESCALHLLREAANVLHTIELGGAREQP